MQATALNHQALPKCLFGKEIFLVSEEFRFWNTDAGTEYQTGHSQLKRSRKIPEGYALHQISSYQNGMLTWGEAIAHPKSITILGYGSHVVAVDGQLTQGQYNALTMALLPPNNAWNTFDIFGRPYSQKTVQRWMDFDLDETVILILKQARPNGFVIEVTGERWSLYHDYTLFKFQQYFNCSMTVLGDSARSFTVKKPIANWGSINRTKADIQVLEQEFTNQNKQLYKEFFLSHDRPDMAERADYYLVKMDKILTSIMRGEQMPGELSSKEQQLAVDFMKNIK